MSRNLKNIALIVAAGQGTRLSKDLPKQYLKINNQTLLEIVINKFLNHPEIDAVAVVISKDQKELYKKNTPPHEKLLEPVYGGTRRQDSVRLGLDYIEQYKPTNVLIHDAARALLEPKYISHLLKALDKKQASCLVDPANDTMRYINNDSSKIVSRKNLYKVQTPQAFHYELIKNLHHQLKAHDATDDISLMEIEKNHDIEYINSSMLNFKITTENDYKLAQTIMETQKTTKIGMGFDAHKFKETTQSDNEIMLCGVSVPCKYEIIAHSDGDVALHSLTDALLGAIGEGDIGQHFPPTDSKWENASSDKFVRFACKLIKEKNAVINNVDLTIISQTPRVTAYRDQMRQQVAAMLDIDQSHVNIKATTTEGLGFTGRREGIACNAVVSIAVMG